MDKFANISSINEVVSPAKEEFVKLLIKKGFIVYREYPNFITYQHKSWDWCFIRCYNNKYSFHLFTDSDTYSLKTEKYPDPMFAENVFILNLLKTR